MGLRIQNNIAAMNAHRQLTISNDAMTKSLERLSSGYRINRAADDAAGLSISQAFRADIASYRVASRNTTEANSLLQVAEGAMDQIGNMLTRLKELATQAASANAGSNLDKIEAEKEKLVAEIERIASSSEYAGVNLLDGSFGEVSNTWDTTLATTNDVILDAENGLTYKYTDDSTDTTTLNFTFNNAAALTADTYTMATAGATTITMTATTSGEAYTGTVSGQTLTFDTIGLTIVGDSALTTNIGSDTLTVADAGFTSMSVESSTTTGTWTIADDGSSVTLSNGSESQAVDLAGDGAQTLDFDQLGIKISLGSNYNAGDLNSLEFDVSNSGQSTFQVGANNVAAEDRITISIGDATTSALGIDGDNLDLSTISGAQSAIDTIDSAIDTLNQERGNIGAYQNRLSFAAANLATTIENVQAAESVIRDVDMAAEMTTFTKNQILMQAGTAMLAQANMAPQQILSLFG